MAPGIIPAYAGNIQRQAVALFGFWDHPRVCGEHFKEKKPDERLTGSSPRMRGTFDDVEVSPESVGIIPAYAGNILRL